MTTGVRAGLGGSRTDVVLHVDAGRDDTTRAELYEYALMHNLRAAGIHARLGTGAGRGVPITIATGKGVTRALHEPPGRVFFYRGRSGLSERRELDRAERALTRRQQEGTIDMRTFLLQLAETQRRIGEDVVVYRSAPV